MDFSFSEEQEMLRSQARSFLSKEFPEDKVVALAERDVPSSDQLSDATGPLAERHPGFRWREIGELGWLGLSAPEDVGGAGMTFLDEAVIIEEMGRALYPGPYLSTVALGLPALARAPEVLKRVASGELAATVAWVDARGRGSLDEGGAIEATDDRLKGERVRVPDADLADVVILVAGSNGTTTMWSGDRADMDVTVRSTMDSTRRLSNLRFGQLPAKELASGEAARELAREMRLRLTVGLALEAVGISQRALELAQQHVNDRQQFGKPIGAYQAVSHQVADTYVGVELARSLAYWAAWCVAESDPQAESAAAAAKSFAAEAGVAACERAIQVHGGIGFTWEHVLHRYYKRAQWIDSFGGFGRSHRARIAEGLLATG